MSSEKTVDNWHDPNSMAPRSSALWGWYKQLSTRMCEAIDSDDTLELLVIAREIDEHAAEMEYQCRI